MSIAEAAKAIKAINDRVTDKRKENQDDPPHLRDLSWLDRMLTALSKALPTLHKPSQGLSQSDLFTCLLRDHKDAVCGLWTAAKPKGGLEDFNEACKAAEKNDNQAVSKKTKSKEVTFALRYAVWVLLGESVSFVNIRNQGWKLQIDPQVRAHRPRPPLSDIQHTPHLSNSVVRRSLAGTRKSREGRCCLHRARPDASSRPTVRLVASDRRQQHPWFEAASDRAGQCVSGDGSRFS